MSVGTLIEERVDADELLAWNEQFRDAPPQQLLRWANERRGTRMALSCSFGGAAGMVLLDMLVKIDPDIPVLYLDTGLLFPETYQLVSQIREHYGIIPRAVRAGRTVAQQAETEGAALWDRDPDLCCKLRKVQPLAEALDGFSAWITGIRRDGGATRAGTNLLEWSNKYNLVKLNPLAFWTERDVWGYVYKHGVPYNPLLDQGYKSLGCATCTRLPNGEDPRSGRWAGFNKTECGLHTEQTS